MAKFNGIVILLSSCLFGYVCASAIPMWEYLSKDEKMAYLYNMFEFQVDDVCKGSNQAECKKDLLKYGLKNLHDMPEDHLDTMDPYQRDANSLIWKSMMDGHQMMKNKQFPSTQTTQNSDRDAYEQFSESNYLGSASSRQETVLSANGVHVAPTKPARKHFGPMVVKVHLDGRPVQGEHSIPEDDDEHIHKIVKQPLPSLASFDVRPTSNYVATSKAPNKHFGPMVVKVHLDGRPVQGEHSIPQDDDVHFHKIVKQRVPTLASFEPYPYATHTRPTPAASSRFYRS